MPGYGDPKKAETVETPAASAPLSTSSPNNWMVSNWPPNMNHIKDAVAVFSGALLVLASQLEAGGFANVAWSAVVASAIGGLIAWSRTGGGGFRKE